MFNKIKEKERLEIYHNAQKELANKLKEYHIKYAQEQLELKKAFDYKKLKQININIWDDFYDDDFTPDGEVQNTYAYVELDNIPNIEVKKILETLIEYISNNALLPNTVDVELDFYDSSTKYPMLVIEYENNLYKRWQIEFKNITHAILDKLIIDLQNIKEINGVKLDIYSES